MLPLLGTYSSTTTRCLKKSTWTRPFSSCRARKVVAAGRPKLRMLCCMPPPPPPLLLLLLLLPPVVREAAKDAAEAAEAAAAATSSSVPARRASWAAKTARASWKEEATW